MSRANGAKHNCTVFGMGGVVLMALASCTAGSLATPGVQMGSGVADNEDVQMLLTQRDERAERDHSEYMARVAELAGPQAALAELGRREIHVAPVPLWRFRAGPRTRDTSWLFRVSMIAGQTQPDDLAVRVRVTWSNPPEVAEISFVTLESDDSEHVIKARRTLPRKGHWVAFTNGREMKVLFGVGHNQQITHAVRVVDRETGQVRKY